MNQETLILSFFMSNPGSTDHECAEVLELPVSTVSARRNKCVQKGLIFEFRKRRCTISRKLAKTWVG